MLARLLACPACARHVRADETRCPFCSAHLPQSFRASPAPIAPPRGLGRAGLLRFNALTAAGVVGGGVAFATLELASCALVDSNQGPFLTPAEAEAGTATPDSDTGTTPAYGGPLCTEIILNGTTAAPGKCSDNEYVLFTSSSCGSGDASACGILAACGFPACEEGDVKCCQISTYALCHNGTYSQCSSLPPPDGSVRVIPPDAAAPDAAKKPDGQAPGLDAAGD
jgi:hypothetical protein